MLVLDGTVLGPAGISWALLWVVTGHGIPHPTEDIARSLELDRLLQALLNLQILQWQPASDLQLAGGPYDRTPSVLPEDCMAALDAAPALQAPRSRFHGPKLHRASRLQQKGVRRLAVFSHLDLSSFAMSHRDCYYIYACQCTLTTLLTSGGTGSLECHLSAPT